MLGKNLRFIAGCYWLIVGIGDCQNWNLSDLEFFRISNNHIWAKNSMLS